MVARIPDPSLPRVKKATGIRLFWSVIMKRLNASIPPVRRTSIGLRAVSAGVPGAPLGAAIRGAAFLDHLVHAHAARDHGIHVRLRIDVEVQDRRPRLLLCPPDSLLHVVTLAHGLAAQAVSGGEPLVVGACNGGLRIATVVEELLPLAHHTQVSVVEDGYLDVEPKVPDGGELLKVHLDAAIPGYHPHRLVRVGESHA